MAGWVIEPTWKTDFSVEITQWMMWLIVAEGLALLLFFLALYLVIKSAIRDGINESKISDNRLRSATARTSELSEKLPPIRAD